MNNNEIQEQFSFFLHECINQKSAEKYIAALKKVSVTLNKIVPEVNSIWEIDTLHDAEIYIDLIYNDPDFVECNNKGNNMYTAAYNWFINFLKTKEDFYAACNSGKQKADHSSSIDNLYLILQGKVGRMAMMYAENFGVSIA